MSKIYEALEKAEREKGFNLDFSEILEFKGEPKEDETEKPGSIPEFEMGEGVISNPQLVSFFQPNSITTEQFRKLRTHLLLQAKNTKSPKTIMVTSATEKEGKSTVAANLATGIARELQAHALLVDCDLRNPTLGSWFGIKDGRGLSDYLSGNGNIPELLRKTEIERLNIITGGSVQDNSTELIETKKMKALIHELKSQYDDRYVILDSPPLLSTTEPEVLARWVDGIVIVVRAGVTPRETVKQAISSLEKEKILGFVLNDLQFKSSGLSARYFGSDGYYYRYGYGSNKGNQNQKGLWNKVFRK
jgi:exopolysaccharide/PEP-CTERM locus tyrosine autokinase